jgi:iron complex transport system ATP-binding protein
MEMTEIREMRERVVTELSGGEQQRVVIAMALAQEPQVLLLDEPTVHLDINHQIEILDLVRKLNRERALTVLATMHDLNLAALYFDDLVLLERGRIVAQGAPSQVLSAERIRAVFNADVLIQPHPARADSPQVVLLPTQRD